MKLTKKIEKKLRSFDWRYVSEIRDGIYVIKDVKDQEPEGITLLDEEHICFWDNSGNDHTCCIDIKNILIF